MGRNCHGLKLTWADFVMGRNDLEPFKIRIINLLLLLPGKGPGSYLNVIGPAGLVMMGKNSRVPKLLVKNRLKLYTIWYSCRMAWIRLGQSTG